MKKISISIIGLLALGFGCFYLGNELGQNTGEASVERLKVVWSNFDGMSKDDRALLAGLSMTCHLEQVELSREKILACLRDGSTSSRLITPKDVTKESVPAKLENLIRQTNVGNRTQLSENGEKT